MSTKILLAVLLICCWAINACSQTDPPNQPAAAGVFVGSTAGDSLIKSLLTIQPDTKVDFIRWDLTLNNGENNANTFVNINFGEGQPNTSGFKGGGQKLSFQGKYAVSQSAGQNLNGEICQLKSDKLPATISLVKLNDNLFHLLTPDNRLMVGNDGWSYTLNRKEPLTNTFVLHSFTTSSALINDTARQVIFGGRTPCVDFVKHYNFQVGNDCNKLKWMLTLQRDPNTFAPTTYALWWTLHRADTVEGKWTISKGSPTNPEAVIYQLDPDKPSRSISFLAGDKNVIYCLDKKGNLFTGDKDFSYTLNKMEQ